MEEYNIPDSAQTPKGRTLVALALEVARSYFFLQASITFLSSRRKTGEHSMLDVALKESSSSWLRIARTVENQLSLESYLWSEGEGVLEAQGRWKQLFLLSLSLSVQLVFPSLSQTTN